MNQDSVQNNQDNSGLVPEEKTEQTADDLMSESQDGLIKKYGHDPLFKKIFKPDKNFFFCRRCFGFKEAPVYCLFLAER